MVSPHGIPVDLLDRLVIVRTETYGPAEMIQVRASLFNTLFVWLIDFDLSRCIFLMDLSFECLARY